MMDKNHIINEIIRTANENNGISLGKQKFARVTGIKYSDWYGIYWSKWNDAIKEAGFEPNKLQGAYDENVLIEYIVSLIREIEKFPNAGEIRLKSNNTSKFPSHSTFRNRLGRKNQMVQKILNYCKGKSGYEDVIETCTEVLASSQKEEEKIDSEEAESQFGYVYLMKSGRYYKIGKSNCVERRNYEIGVKSPEEPKLIHRIKTDDPSGIEAYWHKRFENKRKRGEWFGLSSSDVKVFRRRTFM